MSITGQWLTLSALMVSLVPLNSIATQLNLTNSSSITVNGTDYFELLSDTPLETSPFSDLYTVHITPQNTSRFRFDTAENVEILWHGHFISDDINPDSQWFFLDRFCDDVRNIKVAQKSPDQFFVIPDGECEAIDEFAPQKFITLTIKPSPQDIPYFKPVFNPVFWEISGDVGIDPMFLSDPRLTAHKMHQQAWLENPGGSVSNIIEVNIMYADISQRNLSIIPNYETLTEIVTDAPTIESMFTLVIDTLLESSNIDYLTASLQNPAEFIAAVTNMEGTVNLQKLANFIKGLIKTRNPSLNKEQLKLKLWDAIQVIGDKQNRLKMQQLPAPQESEGATAVLPTDMQHLSLSLQGSSELDLITELISICHDAINPIVKIIFSLNPDLPKAYGVAKRKIKNEDGSINAEAVLAMLQGVPDLKEALRREIRSRQASREDAHSRKPSRPKQRSSQGPVEKKDNS